jgi:ketosteroid isomerase-like protein
MAEDLAADFRPIHEAATAAFNEGDLDRAVAGLPDDFEWQPYDTDLEEGVVRGPDALKSYFAAYREVFDEWNSEPLEYEQVGEGTVLIHHRITGTSRGAGVPVREEVFEVWEFEGGVPRRVRQFPSRERAIAEAGGPTT